MSDTLIKETQDKTGAPVALVYSNSIGGGPVVPFFLKNYAELMENGHAHNFIMGTNKSKAIYAVIDDKVVGHIIFDILDDAIKTCWIVFSCVDAGYRHRGLYTMMHTELENQAKKMGSGKIASHVHVTNNTRQASCISVGMMPVFYRMEKEL